ncbi:TPA: hypothetical protein DEW47_01095 [Patescibacteria group bacterium]|nr:MAG: hypothetical protein UT71_C0006G0013 [Parcubacteria group bacterium GW2011_GWF2_40_10]KKR47335.1 MAG: hypothetical protein UT83_C0011G0019 [Parcubacteria group bacterium GW2011_GWA2_40_143]KKR59977.1 MAG: hypothetical protein UT97_C0007G0013 [Parcubacteria group bacterium GW2011_GWC2_40_31]KKR74621.1 MAG: hypothetical protein UU18_C0022G0012 [Parcubacteria group bacterium GW2011_GWB2_40_8]KKR76396.1 MAG: hypothetical protein UU20_C0026G0010 [Parcubacteria group bacterium GW2011_GWE2_40_
MEKEKIPKIIFGFDKDWELKNWYDTITKNISYNTDNKKTTWGLGSIPEVIKDVRDKHNTEQKIKREIKKIFDDFIKTKKAKTLKNEVLKKAKKEWGYVGARGLFLMSNMLEIPIKEFEQKYYAFFTFSGRAPFYENKFMFNQFGNFTTQAFHEIMHIEFLKKYRDYLSDKGLGKEQIEHLKEIFTVLLNEDLRELLVVPDKGYSGHQIIRSKILNTYKKHRKTRQNFYTFIDKAVKIFKKE